MTGEARRTEGLRSLFVLQRGISHEVAHQLKSVKVLSAIGMTVPRKSAVGECRRDQRRVEDWDPSLGPWNVYQTTHLVRMLDSHVTQLNEK